tara:strand:- start:595 stop:720 length:126 start_codon:yes stop_codon:yes gene_type:complete
LKYQKKAVEQGLLDEDFEMESGNNALEPSLLQLLSVRVFCV